MTHFRQKQAKALSQKVKELRKQGKSEEPSYKRGWYKSQNREGQAK